MIKYIDLEILNLGKVKNLIYSFGENYNLIENLNNNVISSEEIPGAIPAYISKEGNEYKVRYHIANEITLKEYLKNYIGREDLTKIIENIANIVSKAQMSNINLNNYLLNINNVYIDSDTKDISLVYIPITESNEEEDLSINKYVKEVISNVKFGLNDDLNFFVSLHNYLNEENSSINEIVSFMNSIKRKDNISMLENKADNNLIWDNNKSFINKNEVLFKGNNIAIKGNDIKVIEENTNFKVSDVIENREKPLAIHISTNSVNLENNNYYYENNKINVDNEEKYGTTVLDDDDDSDETFGYGTTLLDDYDDEEENEGGTSLLEIEDEDDEIAPILIRNINNEKYELSKLKTKIGRDANSCDFIITNNKLVGRIHALIINDNGTYYIEDNNSTNGTFVNGVKLPKMGKAKIRQGDQIKLANEIFTLN